MLRGNGIGYLISEFSESNYGSTCLERIIVVLLPPFFRPHDTHSSLLAYLLHTFALHAHSCPTCIMIGIKALMLPSCWGSNCQTFIRHWIFLHNQKFSVTLMTYYMIVNHCNFEDFFFHSQTSGQESAAKEMLAQHLSNRRLARCPILHPAAVVFCVKRMQNVKRHPAVLDCGSPFPSISPISISLPW